MIWVWTFHTVHHKDPYLRFISNAAGCKHSNRIPLFFLDTESNLMKSKILTITLLASTTIIGHSNTSFAKDVCYMAGGTITTNNVSPTQQIGKIALTLRDTSKNKEVYSNTGSLVGTITGSDGFGATLLSHVANFAQDGFVTNSDKAILIAPYVRDVLADGTPCSYFIHENISQIAQGTKFFGKVSSVNISADGYVSNCPGENKNEFTLSGELCVK